MKKQPRNSQKLALRSETLRSLDKLALTEVVGGAAPAPTVGLPNLPTLNCLTILVCALPAV
ncbi:MAG TPA: hypothetical protein VH165_30305 [Kofleriaceae bacterium]|nr:hypothetical protein [Kofleriaceae bacterium]